MNEWSGSNSYLPHPPATGAGKDHSVATVIVGCHRTHAFLPVYEEGDALDGAGAPQGLVEVVPAEVVIDAQGLWSSEENETSASRQIQPCRNHIAKKSRVYRLS